MGLDFRRFSGGGGGGSMAWVPLEGMTLGGMTLNDGFITSVTEISPGRYTLGHDYTVNRTTLGTADRYPVDFITEWADADPETHVLQVRFTIVTPPTNVAGVPWVGVYHDNGAFPGSGGAAGAVMLMGSTKRSFDTVGGLGTGIVEGNDLGLTPTEFVFEFTPPVGTTNGRYQIGGQVQTTSEGITRYGFTELSLAAVNAASISAGYNVGSHMALAFQQRALSTGTGSMTLDIHRRVIPVFT